MSTIGNLFKVTVFGESHGPQIGVVISGVPSGTEIDFSRLNLALEKRRGIEELSTSRREQDDFRIVSGFFNGRTTGAPLTFLLDNKDVDDAVYAREIVRPSHADYYAEVKYRGFQDYRGGGPFSGRLSACSAIAGTIAESLLNRKGIALASRVKRIYDVDDADPSVPVETLIRDLNEQIFPTFSEEKKALMQQRIREARAEGDSLGGIVETYIDLRAHWIGGPFFDSVESKLASYLFALGGVKGIAFGEGFGFVHLKGSQANDAYGIENGEVVLKSNRNGGILGGIAGKNPIVFSTVVKPTPSIGKEQETVDLDRKKEVRAVIRGRHDPCIVPRALYGINALSAMAILDLLMEEYGRDFFRRDE